MLLVYSQIKLTQLYRRLVNTNRNATSDKPSFNGDFKRLFRANKINCMTLIKTKQKQTNKNKNNLGLKHLY